MEIFKRILYLLQMVIAVLMGNKVFRWLSILNEVRLIFSLSILWFLGFFIHRKGIATSEILNLYCGSSLGERTLDGFSKILFFITLLTFFFGEINFTGAVIPLKDNISPQGITPFEGNDIPHGYNSWEDINPPPVDFSWIYFLPRWENLLGHKITYGDIPLRWIYYLKIKLN